jgi:NADH-quinone oxidoreductase subunit D
MCHLERERILGLIETITGSRVVPNFIRIGGVKRNIEEETLSDIRKNLPLLFENIRRIEKIMMDDFLIIERLKNIGIISKNIALEYGVTGPNLRASGVRNDLRKDNDFISYRDLSFTAPVGREGDCLERVIIRFREIFQSLKLVNQIINNFPEGDYIKKINLSHLEFQPGAISQDVECPHGIFKIYMEVGGKNIDSLVIKSPSVNSLIVGEEIIRGESLEDIDLILMSLDISPGEIMSTQYKVEY